MSDWTPTTEQVRNGYRYDPEDDYYNPLQAGANAERNARDFDRWLEQVKAEAWDEGYTSGRSNAMRRMSDEPKAPLTRNPYRQEKEKDNAVR